MTGMRRTRHDKLVKREFTSQPHRCLATRTHVRGSTRLNRGAANENVEQQTRINLATDQIIHIKKLTSMQRTKLMEKNEIKIPPPLPSCFVAGKHRRQYYNRDVSDCELKVALNLPVDSHVIEPSRASRSRIFRLLFPLALAWTQVNTCTSSHSHTVTMVPWHYECGYVLHRMCASWRAWCGTSLHVWQKPFHEQLLFEKKICSMTMWFVCVCARARVGSMCVWLGLALRVSVDVLLPWMCVRLILHKIRSFFFLLVAAASTMFLLLFAWQPNHIQMTKN